MIPIFWAKVLFVLGLAFGIAWIVALSHEHGLQPAGWLAAELRNRPIWETAFLAIIVTGFIHHGATKGTNGVPDSAGGGMERISPPIPQSSNPPLPQFPAGGAVTNTDWLAFGGYEDWFHIPDGGWCFRFGANLTERLTVFAFGEVRTSPHDVSNRISLLGLPLSIVPAANWHLIPQPPTLTPQQSLFWHAITSSNSLLLTWRNALVNRDTNLPVTVQAELFPDGAAALRYDFAGLGGGMAALSNAAARIWRDGEAWTVPLQTGEVESVSFPAPPIMDTNALDEVYDRVAGGDSNAYYFAEAVVGKGPARIEVETDGDSALGGYRLMAEPGVTNRLPLLIGPRYAVSSEAAFAHFALMPSEMQTEESHPSATNVTDRLVEARWPVEFGLDEVSASPAKTVYALHVVPDFLCGTVSWSGAATNGPMRGAPPLCSGGDGCTCGCQSYSTNTVSHASSCSCGECSASGDYGYEGHSEHFELPFPDTAGGDPPDPPNPGGDPDPLDPSGPSVSVSFDKPVVIFEDQYENSPGVFVARRSTTTKLTVTAHGGENGGTLSLVVDGSLVKCAGQSEPPGYVPPYGTVSWQANYEGVSANSSQDSTQATVTFTDGQTGNKITSAPACITVIEIEISSISLKPVECRNRHIYGICEQLQLTWHPTTMQLLWNTQGVGSWKSTGPGWRHFQCPDSAMQFSLVASCSNADLPVYLSSKEPEQVCCSLSPEFLQKIGLGHNMAGDAGMLLIFTVCPTNVSFENVRFMEIPSLEGTNSGYFAELRWQDFWYHGTVQGAGKLILLNEDNDGEDQAYIGLCAPPLSNGTLNWGIPAAWQPPAGSGSNRVMTQFTHYNQQFIITNDGTLSVSKFGHAAERGTNTIKRIDGVIVP